MIPWLEIGANTLNATSIVLAARNSIHTWWIGILGCSLFSLLFYHSQLYADTLLQVFFIGTSAYGWRLWMQGPLRPALPITRTTLAQFLYSVAATLLVSGLYGYLLHRFTNAYAPFIDSTILGLSVLAQILLMKRRYESWWIWIAVNTLSVALFASRELWITAALYAIFWVNAVAASILWRRRMAPA